MGGRGKHSKPNKSSKVLFKFGKQVKMSLGFGVLPFCFFVRFLFCLLTREPCWWLVLVMSLFLGGLCDFVFGSFFFVGGWNVEHVALLVSALGLCFFVGCVMWWCGSIHGKGGKAWRLLDFFFLEFLR
ncbi:hypothetical protein Pint_35921 [Pistacia integerrima]|uniref:Uncharacterized protein n=1 Tax=Pistacia integerrima TaxID=434235 RepID=A0ACC0Y0M6_9ROSI|nr:hypothetical protein Pint_35921 [Pistacia integerrima]